MPTPIEAIMVPTLMMCFGYVLKRKSFFKKSDRELLASIVFYITLPSMIFINMSKASISQDMLFLPILSFTTSLILIVISYIYCKIRNYSKKTTWAIIIASSIMNTGFIGFPVCLGVFGNEGFINAVFFDMATTAMVVIYGVILAKEFGGDGKAVVKKIITFIPLWAVVFALIFNVFSVPLPYVADQILNYLGQATIPLIMFCLGISLEFGNIGQNICDSIVVSVIKLVFAPAIIFVLLSLFNIKGMAFNVGVLEAGMSTAMNALVLSGIYGLDEDFMASLIFTNVILSIFSLTVIISFLV